MFKLNEKYEVDGKNLKRKHIRYSPSEISTINTPNRHIKTIIPREVSVNTVSNSRRDVNFDVLNATTNNRYVDGDDIRLNNIGPVALFSIYKMTSSSGKHIEEIRHAHIVSLVYKLTTSAEDSDYLSI